MRKRRTNRFGLLGAILGSGTSLAALSCGAANATCPCTDTETVHKNVAETAADAGHGSVPPLLAQVQQIITPRNGTRPLPVSDLAKDTPWVAAARDAGAVPIVNVPVSSHVGAVPWSDATAASADTSSADAGAPRKKGGKGGRRLNNSGVVAKIRAFDAGVGIQEVPPVITRDDASVPALISTASPSGDDCTFGSVTQTPVSPDASAPAEEQEPVLVTALMPGIAALACGTARGSCLPTFVRDENVVLSAFRKPRIRYGWNSIIATAKDVSIVQDTKPFVWFTLTLLAHEYGHFLDLVNADGKATANFCKGSVFCSNFSEHLRRELFADSVSGCVLARAGTISEADAITKAIDAYAKYPSPDHPEPNARRHAMLAGWKQCDNDKAPSLAFAPAVLHMSDDETGDL